MKKTIIPSIIAIMITVPSLGTVIDNTNCDSGTLQTTSGDATLRAKFDANTINIKYYNGDTEITSTVNNNAKSCTYDAGITLPSTNPTKAGYTFNGWKVKVAQCTASMLPSGDYYGGDNAHISQDGSESYGANEYGLTENGEWAAPLQEVINEDAWILGPALGIMRGTSFCSAKSGDNHWGGWGGNSADWLATHEKLTEAGDGKYCWCHGTSYTPTNGEQCSVPASRWVFDNDFETSSNCASNCAVSCSAGARDLWALRVSLFGQN